jgi:hypothetical protein
MMLTVYMNILSIVYQYEILTKAPTRKLLASGADLQLVPSMYHDKVTPVVSSTVQAIGTPRRGTKIEAEQAKKNKLTFSTCN